MNIDDILNKIDPTNLTIAFGKINKYISNNFDRYRIRSCCWRYCEN